VRLSSVAPTDTAAATVAASRLYDHRMVIQVASPAELDLATLYAVLRLRGDIFVVEQECPYADLDGRDLAPTTRHLWYEAEPAGTGAGAVGPAVEPAAEPNMSAYLRIVRDPDGTARIGRVCTAKHARGAGLSARLVEAALELIGDQPCVLDAQSYLVAFYGRYGFVASGPEFVEDGIPHIPMRRP
jgi:ElaA protein